MAYYTRQRKIAVMERASTNGPDGERKRERGEEKSLYILADGVNNNNKAQVLGNTVRILLFNWC